MAHDILIVDDESDIRALIAGSLSDEGYDTRAAWDSESALAAIESRLPSMVLLDIWLQGSKHDGIELLKQIQENHPDLPVTMISGHGNIETAVAAIRLGAYDFIEKPFEADRLLLNVHRTLETVRLRRENEELRQRAGGAVELIGQSSVINMVRQAIERVAATGSRVLISGPAGSGKEVAARLVHQQSRRAAGPFIVLNAASMAPERMEEELFGVERGAAGPDSATAPGRRDRPGRAGAAPGPRIPRPCRRWPTGAARRPPPRQRRCRRPCPRRRPRRRWPGPAPPGPGTRCLPRRR